MKHFDPVTFRAQFPAFKQSGIYLDSAATALKPQVMIDATVNYYAENSCNIERGHYKKALELNEQYEQTRHLVAELVNAPLTDSIIWTQGTTHSINFISQNFARPRLNSGDEIIVSELEHHCNLIPWQIVAKQTGAKIVTWPINKNYQLDIDELKQRINSRTKILAITQMSNVTGTAPDMAAICELAKANNIITVVDGAQGIVHHPINIAALGIDFYAFSAHKLYGPTGLGVLYIHPKHIKKLPAWFGGGKMLTDACMTEFEPARPPQRFEAGTPNIAGVLGFNATLIWLKSVDMLKAERYSAALAAQAYEALSKLGDFQGYYSPGSSLFTFNFLPHHASDVAILLDEQDMAVRDGQHCAHPLMKALDVKSSLRVSFAPYNLENDVIQLVNAIESALLILS